MNTFLIPAAATALFLTGMHTANAWPGCGMYKSNYHHAVMKDHPHYRGTPQAYRTGHYDYIKKDMGAGGYGKQKAAKAQPNLVDVAASAGAFNTLIAAVKAAGLADTLAVKGPYTVFAPTDEAFARLPAGTLDGLLANKPKLIQVLTYHVVPGKLSASAVSGVKTFNTVEGSELPVATIKIAKTDVMASNGIIHVIDEVLIPEA